MFTHDLTGISVSFVKKKAIENESSKEAESNWIPCKIKIVQIKRWYYLSNKFQAQHVNDNLFSKLVYSFGSISSCNLIRIAILVSKNVAFFCVWQHINIMAMQCILMCSINRETQNQELLHMLVWFANIGYLVARSKGDFRAVAAGCNGEEGTKYDGQRWQIPVVTTHFKWLDFLMCECIFKMDCEGQSEIPTDTSAQSTHVKKSSLSNSCAFKKKNEETFVIKNAQTAQSFCCARWCGSRVNRISNYLSIYIFCLPYMKRVHFEDEISFGVLTSKNQFMRIGNAALVEFFLDQTQIDWIFVFLRIFFLQKCEQCENYKK